MTSLTEKISSIRPKSIASHILAGWAIGLVLITLLVLSADDPDPAWGPWWLVRPLVITPMASSLGMLAFFLRPLINPKTNFSRFIVFLASLIIYLVALWMGFVLGLDGTMWN